MPPKTNAARLLDQAGIKYQLGEYEVDESDLSAINVANKLGYPVEQVFKTLVARGDKTGVLLACIPGHLELNLKSLATVSGNKKVEVVPLKEVQALTGYIRGGVSPLGTKKKYPVYMDVQAELHDTVSISAGVRGCQMLLNPSDLIKVTGAVLGDISK